MSAGSLIFNAPINYAPVQRKLPDISSGTFVDGIGRLRPDRKMYLDATQGSDYPVPPPLGRVDNPTLLLKNIQALQADLIYRDGAQGECTHVYHSRNQSICTVPRPDQHVGHPILMSTSKLHQLGYKYNISHLRYTSVLTVGDDQAMRLANLAAAPVQAQFPQQCNPLLVNTIR